MDSPSEHFKQRKNTPMARQTFLAIKTLAGETINNFSGAPRARAQHHSKEYMVTHLVLVTVR